jgi:PAS domain S-box-containing protein
VAANEHIANAGSRFELLVQSITDYAIYMIDAEGRVTSWNPGARRLKGYEPEEIIGEHFSRFYTHEEREKEVPRIALETAQRDGHFETEGLRVRKDGSRFWSNIVIDPIRDPAGNLLGFAMITRDLTKDRAAGEELRRSEERFRLLVQSVTDYAIYMLDPKGHVSSWNPGAERLKATWPVKSWANTSRASIRKKTAWQAFLASPSRLRSVKGASKPKGGEFAKTVLDSGPA